jgi:putative oxidoreductase
MNLPFDHNWFLRLAIGTVFLYHGLTKDLKGFSTGMNLPLVVGGLVIFAEIAGGLGYLLGGFNDKEYLGFTITQWSSLAVIPVLIGAIYLVHWKNGFDGMKGGFEYQFTLLMIALYFLFN